MRLYNVQFQFSVKFLFQGKLNNVPDEDTTQMVEAANFCDFVNLCHRL